MITTNDFPGGNMDYKTALNLVEEHLDRWYGPGGTCRQQNRPTITDHAREIVDKVPDYADDDLAVAIQLVAYGR